MTDLRNRLDNILARNGDQWLLDAIDVKYPDSREEFVVRLDREVDSIVDELESSTYEEASSSERHSAARIASLLRRVGYGVSLISDAGLQVDAVAQSGRRWTWLAECRFQGVDRLRHGLKSLLTHPSAGELPFGSLIILMNGANGNQAINEWRRIVRGERLESFITDSDDVEPCCFRSSHTHAKTGSPYQARHVGVTLNSIDRGLGANVGRLTTVESAPILISVHGIRTTGRWQKDLTEAAQNLGVAYQPLDFGYFGAFSLLIPSARRQKVEWFHDECGRIFASKSPNQSVSVAAHSFGTYLVASALSKYADLKFDRVIFCGSIVRREYPWTSIIDERGQVNAVLNEAGRKDLWSALVTWVVADAGASGVTGFIDLAQGRVTQRIHAEHAHSDYFYKSNFKKIWIPFMLGSKVGEVIPLPAPPTNWRFVVSMVTLIGLLFVGIWWFGS